MNKGKGNRGKAGGQKLFQGQQPNEANDAYVRRVYSRKAGEGDDDYYLRIVSKYSNESEEEYKDRIAVIQGVLTELPLKDKIIYDDHAKMYIYIRSSVAGSSSGHPGQLQNESEETYVRRVYTRKTTESEKEYYMRITSKYSSETDESYKSRVTLIFKIFTDISIENVKYDENRKLFVYVQSSNTKKDTKQGAVTSKGYPGQQPNESDENYVKRVYTKKTDETEEKYITRVISRYAAETDEVYKSRIELIITTIKEINIREHIKYDTETRVYVYVKSTKTDKKKKGDQKTPEKKDGEKKLYPNQLPDETDEAYVCRLYSKEKDETDDVYILRILTRYSNETDEVYKSRIQLIITIIKEVNIKEHIKYDEKRKLFVYMRPAGAKPEGPPAKYPNQRPGEDDEAYVSRVYSKKTDETDEVYIMRVLGRYSSETDEVYKSRIQLVIKVMKDIKIQECIRYDEKKNMYVYVKQVKAESKKEPEVVTIEVENYEGQKEDESDEDFVRRVYSKKQDENEEKYIKRIITKSSTESDEMYKSRVELIITVITEINIAQHIKYDDKKKIYVYVKPSKGQMTKQITTKTVTQTTETQICTKVGSSYNITED